MLNGLPIGLFTGHTTDGTGTTNISSSSKSKGSTTGVDASVSHTFA